MSNDDMVLHRSAITDIVSTPTSSLEGMGVHMLRRTSGRRRADHRRGGSSGAPGTMGMRLHGSIVGNSKDTWFVPYVYGKSSRKAREKVRDAYLAAIAEGRVVDTEMDQ